MRTFILRNKFRKLISPFWHSGIQTLKPSGRMSTRDRKSKTYKKRQLDFEAASRIMEIPSPSRESWKTFYRLIYNKPPVRSLTSRASRLSNRYLLDDAGVINRRSPDIIDNAGKSAWECSRVYATGTAALTAFRLINYCGFSTPRGLPVEGPSGRVATLEHNLTSGILTSSLLRDPSDQYLCGARNTRNCSSCLRI